MSARLRSRRSVAAIGLLLALSYLGARAQDTGLAEAERLYPDALVDAVLESNPAVPAAHAAARAARSRIEPAGALDDPMLSTMAAPLTVGSSTSGTGLAVELSQRLPWPGKRRLQEKIAAFEARAVTQSIENARLDLVQLAKEAFADWHLVHAALEINDANRRIWERVRETAEIQYANGTGGKQDILQAEMEYQMLDHRRVALERQRVEVSAELRRLLNSDPDGRLPPPAPLAGPSRLEPLSELRELALTRRAELEAAEAAVEADRARVALAERDFYPDLRVSTGYNRMWADDDMRWTVGIGIDIPLDRGKRRAVAAGARAEAMQSRWRREDLSLRVVREVEQAYARVVESRHMLELSQDQLLPLARENLEAAQTAYRARTGTLESLLRAERSLVRSELDYETARADYYRGMAALERAVGGWRQLAVVTP